MDLTGSLCYNFEFSSATLHSHIVITHSIVPVYHIRLASVLKATSAETAVYPSSKTGVLVKCRKGTVKCGMTSAEMRCGKVGNCGTAAAE